MKNEAAAALGRIRTEKKATAARENGKKGGRPRASELSDTIRAGYDWLLVVAYDCNLGERGTVISRHKSYAGARQAGRRSGFDSSLAIKNTADMLDSAPK